MTRRLRQCLLVLSATAACGAFTDAATRVAYDLEGGAKRLRSSSERTLAVKHVPQATPEGCPGDYTLQLSQESALLVWCQDSIGGPSTGSHTTTYHLNYVSVPQTLVIHKHAGEHAWIELTKHGDAVVVSALR
jgi:hypothetical protein